MIELKLKINPEDHEDEKMKKLNEFKDNKKELKNIKKGKGKPNKKIWFVIKNVNQNI